MDDLRGVGVDLLTLGQYLRPTSNHLPVERYVTPAEFDALPRGRTRTRLPRMRRGAAGSLELPGGARARRQ